jgi:pimeloyl-ACP methyl ester carboxylesterase
MNIPKMLVTGLAALLLVFTLGGCSDNNNNNSSSKAQVMPIVFVHGQSGSAQQFETQAMRFTSNDYPRDMLYAFEYDTSLEINPIGDLDDFIDGVLAATGAQQVYAIGHSRGTSVWTAYLDSADFSGPDKVAKYVNIDGRSPQELPGGVPTIGIWGEWNTANSGYNRREDNSNAQIGPDPEDNFYFADKSHTETATSAEAFELMYEFLTGIAPRTSAVEAEQSGEVEVAGRAVFFPENLGYAGSTVEVWEIDAGTGQRLADSPLASFDIDSSGDFGPVSLNTQSYYEFALLRPATDTFPAESVHHFYAEPFIHDDYFFRLQSSLPGESISAFIPRSADSSGLVLLRQREFWGDQGATSDEIFIDGLNVLTPEISPREAVNLAVFTFDDESDNTTDLAKGELPPFNFVTFLTAADVFIPAVFDGSGTVEIVLVDRGGSEVRLNVPNRPSLVDRTSVMFRDDMR